MNNYWNYKFFLPSFGLFIILLGCVSNKTILFEFTDDVYSLYAKANSLDSSSLFYVKNRYLIDLLLNAKKNESLGQYASAIVDLLEALKYDSSKVFLYSIARNFLFLGKTDLAFDYAFKSFLKDPNFNINLELLITILQEKERYAEAKYFSEHLLNLEKPNYRITTIGRHLSILEKLDSTFSKAIYFCDLFPRNDKYLFLLERKIYYYFNKSDSLDELRAFDTLYTMNKDYFLNQTIFCVRYAFLLLSIRHFENFIKLLKDYVSQYDISQVSLFLLSLDSLFKKIQKENPEIIENFVQILKSRFSKEKDFDIFLLSFYYSIGNIKKASEFENHIVENDEISLESLLQIAKYKYSFGNKSSATEVLEKFSYKFSDNIDYLLFLSNLYIFQDSLDKAEKILNNALSIDSLNDNIYSNMGWLYDKWGKFALSDMNYENAIEINPRNDVALNNYAYALIERGERLDYAKELIETALELSPNNPSFLDTYGWLFYKLKKYQLALQYILKSIKLGVESYEPFLHLAIIYFELGENNLAQEYIQKAFEMEPNNEKINKKMKEIIK